MSGKELKNGVGEIFTDVNPDNMRSVFRKKDKGMKSKVTTVSEAVEKYINNGDYVAIGGFGGVRISTALIHEMIRQKKKNLCSYGQCSR